MIWIKYPIIGLSLSHQDLGNWFLDYMGVITWQLTCRLTMGFSGHDRVTVKEKSLIEIFLIELSQTQVCNLPFGDLNWDGQPCHRVVGVLTRSLSYLSIVVDYSWNFIQDCYQNFIFSDKFKNYSY